MKKIITNICLMTVPEKKILKIFVGIILLITAHTSSAQNKWSVELRTGVDFATKDLGDAHLDTGVGFEGAFAYRFMPHLAAYAG